MQAPRDPTVRIQPDQDLLWAVRHAADSNRTSTPDIEFVVYRVPPTGPQTRAVCLTLVLHLHQGDHGETVATIGRPDPPNAGQVRLPDPATIWPAAGPDRGGTW